MSGIGGHILPLRLRCRISSAFLFATGQQVPHLRVTMGHVTPDRSAKYRRTT